ncbi:MAG: phosphoribosylaminoimidazolesuccinocarboxamide synthase [Patescibacteria group bacterium]
MKLAKVGEIIHEGSAKNVHHIDSLTIAFRALKNFSVFDVGRSKDEIPGKDLAITACAVKSFSIANEIGVPNHFIEQLDPITIRVKKANIITGRYIAGDEFNYMVPVEFIYRLFVAGSIDRDFRSGKKKPEDYGLPAGIIPELGTPFPNVVHHPTTKYEVTDRDLTDNHELCLMAGITLKDLAECWSMVDHVIGAVRLEMVRAGFGVLDGKLEFRMNELRKKEIADVFGTPDEDRPVPLKKLREGEVIHYSKEFLRQYFIEIGYKKEVDNARAAEKADPPYPELPKSIVQDVSQRYLDFAQAYSGQKLTD